MKSQIVIESLKIFGKSKTLISFSTSKEIDKYFNEKNFYVEYDFNISKIPEYILTIPAICNLIQVAWVTDSDLFVNEIDQPFLDSLSSIKKVFKKNFGVLNFNSKILSKNVIHLKEQDEGVVQLYSGGIDSTATCLNNLESKNHLTIIDFEPAGIHKEIVNWAKHIYGNASVAKTNIYSFLNRRNLDKDFGKFTEDTWWGGIQHGIGLIGMTAPAAFTFKANKIFISSTHDKSFKDNWGSDPSTDNLLKWSNVSVLHKDYEFTRHEKIKKIIKKYITKNSSHPLMVVCNSYSRKRELYNCSKCAKCAQAIVSLCIEEIDPNKCGFNVTEKTFAWIKESLESMTYFGRKSDFWTWQDTYKNLPETIDNLVEHVPGTKYFLNWFSKLEFTYEDYFNKTTVMRDRPSYELFFDYGEPDLRIK